MVQEGQWRDSTLDTYIVEFASRYTTTPRVVITTMDEGADPVARLRVYLHVIHP
jgi:hypothetical protein